MSREEKDYVWSCGKNRHVLLLNASYEVIRVTTWQRAVKLFFQHKAVCPAGYDHYYTITSLEGDYHLPSALVLKSYVHVPYFKVFPSRKNVFRRDGYICQYTGERLNHKTATVDHIVPRSKGGKNTWENMVTCKRGVNQRKGSRSLKESGLKLIRQPKQPSRAELVINPFHDMECWTQYLPAKK